MLDPADGEGGRAATVGESEEGVLHTQRQHGVDVQRRLAALGTEDEGVCALRFQVCQIAQTAGEDGGVRICRDDVAGIFQIHLVGRCGGDSEPHPLQKYSTSPAES